MVVVVAKPAIAMVIVTTAIAITAIAITATRMKRAIAIKLRAMVKRRLTTKKRVNQINAMAAINSVKTNLKPIKMRKQIKQKIC